MKRVFNLRDLGHIYAPWEEKRSTLAKVPIKATLSGVGWFRHCAQREGEWKGRPIPGGCPIQAAEKWLVD